MGDTKMVLEILQSSLEHIKEVQANVKKLNQDSMTKLSDAIFKANVEINEEGFVALQHQDILTQQLNATSELLEMINTHISESEIENLKDDIAASLEVAKAKKDAFSGNAFEHKHEDLVELF